MPKLRLLGLLGCRLKDVGSAPPPPTRKAESAAGEDEWHYCRLPSGGEFRRRGLVRIAPLCQAVAISTMVANCNAPHELSVQPIRAITRIAPWIAPAFNLVRADTLPSYHRG